MDKEKAIVYMTNEVFKGSYQVPGHVFRMLESDEYQPQRMAKAGWFD